MAQTKNPPKTEKVAPKEAAPTYYYAVGRRKEATARVRLYVLVDETLTLGDKTYERGQISVNDRPVETYFAGEAAKKLYLEPFRTTNTIGRFVVIVKTVGGGLNGQLAAFIHAIARALDKVEPEKFHPILRKRGFLTRDPRAKQRRKAGYAQKARKKKQSPKR